MPSLGPSLPPAFQLWLLPTCLSASGGGWACPQPANSPLVFAQSFVWWAELAVPYVRALHGKVLSLSFLFFFFFSPLAIPWVGLLSHVGSLRLPSHSGLLLTLSNAVWTSLFSPCLLVVDTSVCATSPLGVAVRRVICGFYLFFPPGSDALCASKTPRRPACERVSWCLETSLLQLPPRDRAPSLTLLSLFLSFIFFLPPFEDNGLPFWVPGVLRQCSEFVLWYLVSVQINFQWICGGESGLPFLFLHHLRTTACNVEF